MQDETGKRIENDKVYVGKVTWQLAVRRRLYFPAAVNLFEL